MADPITDQVTQVASDVAAKGGNFFSNMFGSLLKMPTAALRGAMGSLWSGAMFTAGIAGLKLFAPQLWRLALTTIGGKQAATNAALKYDPAHGGNGIPGVIMDSAVEGFGAAAALGAAGGVVGSGGIVGTVAMAAVGAVAIGAIYNKGHEGTPTPPLTTPSAPNRNDKAKG